MATVVFIISIIYFGRLSSGSLNLGNISQVWIYVLLLGAVSTGLAYLFYNLALEIKELRGSKA